MLEPTLVDLGFQTAQGGDDDLLFCGPTSLGERFPDVLASYDAAQPATCLDLHVAGSVDGGIARLDFEGRALDRLLAELGHPAEARRLELALAGPSSEALAAIADTAVLLFGPND